MDGKERLCLAQISNTLLKDYSYNEIHNRRVALGITCVQCTPVQASIQNAKKKWDFQRFFFLVGNSTESRSNADFFSEMRNDYQEGSGTIMQKFLRRQCTPKVTRKLCFWGKNSRNCEDCGIHWFVFRRITNALGGAAGNSFPRDTIPLEPNVSNVITAVYSSPPTSLCSTLTVSRIVTSMFNPMQPISILGEGIPSS